MMNHYRKFLKVIKSDLFKNDLDFEHEDYSVEAILANLTLIIFPRSMAGLNLNPNEEETEFQLNQVEVLLKRQYMHPQLHQSQVRIENERYRRKQPPLKIPCPLHSL